MRRLLCAALLAGALAGVALAQSSNRYPTGAKGGGATTVLTVVTSQAVVVGQSPFKLMAYGTPRSEWTSAAMYLGSGATTAGGRFFVTVANKVTGARFWWDHTSTIPASVRCSLYDVDGATRIAFVDVAPIVHGINSCTFATPPTVQPYHRYEITTYAGAAGYSYFTTSSDPQVVPSLPLQGINFVWLSWSRWKSGDGLPDSNATTEKYPIEPTFAPVP
jgi:hypothetical protein